VSTVIDARWLLDSVACTEIFVRGVGVNARQISAVPNCTFVRLTSVHVRLAPVTVVMVVFVPGKGASVAMKASSTSLLEVVENVAEVIKVALEELSLNASASRVSMLEPVPVVTIRVAVFRAHVLEAGAQNGDPRSEPFFLTSWRK
jgi:hypothetical protein